MPLYRLPSSLKLHTKITANHRFTTYQGLLDREPVFVKVAARPETIAALIGEIVGLRYFYELASTDEQAPFAVPEILGFGKNYLITTYVDGIQAKAIYPNMDLLVDSFAWIDRNTFVPRKALTRFSMPTAEGPNQAVRQAAKLKVTPYKQYFDKELIDKALEGFKDRLELFVPRFTHADMGHKHLLLPVESDAKDGVKPLLIDFESCSALWPRFYDVVNYALKFLYRFPYDSEFANSFMAKYLSSIGETYEAHKEEIHGLVLLRALSAIHEHLGPVDVKNNTEKIMDKDMADILSDILRKTLKGKNVFSAQ